MGVIPEGGGTIADGEAAVAGQGVLIQQAPARPGVGAGALAGAAVAAAGGDDGGAAQGHGLGVEQHGLAGGDGVGNGGVFLGGEVEAGSASAQAGIGGGVEQVEGLTLGQGDGQGVDGGHGAAVGQDALQAGLQGGLAVKAETLGGGQAVGDGGGGAALPYDGGFKVVEADLGTGEGGREDEALGVLGIHFAGDARPAQAAEADQALAAGFPLLIGVEQAEVVATDALQQQARLAVVAAALVAGAELLAEGIKRGLLAGKQAGGHAAVEGDDVGLAAVDAVGAGFGPAGAAADARGAGGLPVLAGGIVGGTLQAEGGTKREAGRGRLAGGGGDAGAVLGTGDAGAGIGDELTVLIQLGGHADEVGGDVLRVLAGQDGAAVSLVAGRTGWANTIRSISPPNLTLSQYLPTTDRLYSTEQINLQSQAHRNIFLST